MTGWLWGGRGRDSVQRVPSVQQYAAAAKAPATRSLLGGRSRAPREQAGDNLQLPIRCPERRDAAGGSLPRPRSGYAGREHGQILRSTPFDGAFVAVARAAAGDAADHRHDGARQGADCRPRTQGGAIDLIQKPFSDQSLLERIRQAIDLDRRTRCTWSPSQSWCAWNCFAEPISQTALTQSSLKNPAGPS